MCGEGLYCPSLICTQVSCVQMPYKQMSILTFFPSLNVCTHTYNLSIYVYCQRALTLQIENLLNPGLS